MNELHDDDLILYFYGEAENPDEVRKLLAGSAELRARYEALRATLETAGEALPVPPRPASYGGEVWERLVPRLDETEVDGAPPPEPSPLPLSQRERGKRSQGGIFLPPLPLGEEGRGGEGHGPARRRRPQEIAFWAAAALLLLVLGFLAGRLWPPRPDSPTTATAPLPAAARERILVRTVAAHLESSERLLTEVTNTGTDGAVDLSAERQWARDLLAANRLYRQSAERGGRPRLVALLDELEPFLLELAHSSGETGGEEIADLRSRLAEQALLFKVRVVSQWLAGKQTL